MIESPRSLPGFINLLGIESPGLTAAPAIARMVVSDLLREGEILGERWQIKKPLPKPQHPIPRVRDMSIEQWQACIDRDPNFGEVICHCEKVTRAEVRMALANPLGVKTLQGLKARCRVTAGNCQGQFCLLQLASELEGVCEGKPTAATLDGKGSELFIGQTKDLLIRSKGKH